MEVLSTVHFVRVQTEPNLVLTTTTTTERMFAVDTGRRWGWRAGGGGWGGNLANEKSVPHASLLDKRAISKIRSHVRTSPLTYIATDKTPKMGGTDAMTLLFTASYWIYCNTYNKPIIHGFGTIPETGKPARAKQGRHSNEWATGFNGNSIPHRHPPDPPLQFISCPFLFLRNRQRNAART